MRILASIFFLLLLSKSSYASNFVGKDLLEYFGANCPSQGDWTKLAVNDAESLIRILDNLAKDEDCRTAAGSIANLKSLSNKIQNIQANNQLKVEIEKWKTKEFELNSQLSQTSDPVVISEIQAAIRESQIQKASLMVEQNAQNEYYGSDVKDLYSQIVISSNQTFQALANNNKCLDKNPRLVSSLTSLFSSIGGAITSIDPAFGIGLSAGSEFLGNTVENLRSSKINKQMRKIANTSLLSNGFKCALEALNNRWCDLQDAKDLMQFKFENSYQSKKYNSLEQAIRIYDRDYSSFLDWLSKIRSGAPASTEADASRHSLIYIKQQILQSARASGYGVSTPLRKVYLSSTSNTDRYNVIKEAITKLVGVCSDFTNNNSINPLFNIYNSQYAPYYLLGFDRIPRNGDFNIDFCSFDPFTDLPEGSYQPDFELMVKQYEQWLLRAEKLVNIEFSNNLQPDPIIVLSSAYERSSNIWKLSAKESLSNIIHFIESNKPQDFENSAFKMIYVDTISKLKQIQTKLQESLSSVSKTDPNEAIESIYNIANLQHGTLVFGSRIEMIIRVSIDEYFKKIKPEEMNIAAQFLNADTYLSSLRKITGKDSDELVYLDITNAQTSSLNNMINFVDVFAENLNDILKANAKTISSTKDKSIRRISEQEQARICNLLSSLPTYHKKIEMKYCYGTKLKSFISGGPETSEINSNYLSQDFDKRNCSYRDYIRKSKIFREWGIKI